MSAEPLTDDEIIRLREILDNQPYCCSCGKNVSLTSEGVYYDDDGYHSGDVCPDCAITETISM